MVVSQPAWEVTFLRRPPDATRPRMAGRVVLEAPNLDHARRLAEEALTKRRETTRLSGDRSTWSLGVLRPLTPKAPPHEKAHFALARSGITNLSQVRSIAFADTNSTISAMAKVLLVRKGVRAANLSHYANLPSSITNS